MAVVNKTRTYGVGATLTNTNYNDDRDEVIAGVNSVVDAQIPSGAAIQESKIAFNGGAGHDHSGGTNGKGVLATGLAVTGLTPLKFIRTNSAGTALESADLTVFNRGFTWFLNKDLVVEVDPGVDAPVPQAMTAIKLWGYLKLAPSGNSVIVAVKKTSGIIVATLTFPVSQQAVSTTTMTNPALNAGDYLMIEVLQVGSSTAGRGLSLMLECSQP